MLEFLLNINPIVLVVIATIITWLTTSLGASVVFFFKKVNAKYMNGMLGLASGIMIAASFWSLLEPALEIAKNNGYRFEWVPVTIGFLLGAFFIFIIDKTLPHLHLGKDIEDAEGIKTKWNRSTLLVMSITLHNIPEGLAIGVAFASLTDTSSVSMLMPAIVLTIGIAIQNIPEGAAVSLPLRREGFSRKKSFFWGQFSGVVEILGGVIGVVAVMMAQSILPYALAFSAGAMLYVVVEELIPQSQIDGKTDIPTIGAIIGFAIMMILDNAIK